MATGVAAGCFRTAVMFARESCDRLGLMTVIVCLDRESGPIATPIVARCVCMGLCAPENAAIAGMITRCQGLGLVATPIVADCVPG